MLQVKESGFEPHFDVVDKALHEEDGITIRELEKHGTRRVAPGFTIQQYVGTLMAFDKVEEVDGVIRYPRARRVADTE